MGELRTFQGALSGIGEDLDLDSVAARKRLEEAFDGSEVEVGVDPAQGSVFEQTIVRLGGGACYIMDADGIDPDSGLIDW